MTPHRARAHRVRRVLLYSFKKDEQSSVYRYVYVCVCVALHSCARVVEKRVSNCENRLGKSSSTIMTTRATSLGLEMIPSHLQILHFPRGPIPFTPPLPSSWIRSISFRNFIARSSRLINARSRVEASSFSLTPFPATKNLSPRSVSLANGTERLSRRSRDFFDH